MSYYPIILRKILYIGIILVLSGCTTIVTTGRMVSLDNVSKFKQGETTPKDVENLLGKPENIVHNTLDNTIIYAYQQISSKVFTFGIPPWLVFGRKYDAGFQLNVAFFGGIYQGYTLTELKQRVLGKSKDSPLISTTTEETHVQEEIIKGNVHPKPYERINIIGKNTENASKGVFDPSLEHDDNGVIWMVYTAIEMEKKGNAHSTDLAKSEDGGKTWQYVVRINDSPMGEVTLNGKKIFGNWRNEVATLVDDRDDPDSSKRWKLFWHKYFQKAPFGQNDRLAAVFGWIAYKYAASPTALAQAEEIRLFGNYPAPLNPANGKIQYPVKHYLNQIDQEIEGFLAFTEPGSLVKDGRIYLSLQTVHSDLSHKKTQIFLISSEDHGNTWRYHGVLIDHADAKNLNTPFLTASSLFEENNRTFILASPVTPKGHNGILVFEFENIAEAKLKRDSSGNLILVKRVEPFIEGEFSGCGDYDSKKTYGGIIMSVTDILKVIERKRVEGCMQIFDTKEKL